MNIGRYLRGEDRHVGTARISKMSTEKSEGKSNSELIERAAKAIKLPECGWMGPAFMYIKDNTFTDWNPIENLNDAMMLAFALYMRLQITPHGAAASIEDTFRLVALDEATDVQSALCLAITKLAATRG